MKTIFTMKKHEFELEKKFVSLNGYQMNAIRGGDEPGDNGEEGGDSGPGSGPGPGNGDCDTNLQGGQHCTTVYHGPGGTDNLCGTCPFHKNG